MTDASSDEFIAELEDEFGLEGYARWWKLLETIAVQMDETDRCSVAYPVQKWLRILKAKRNKLNSFLVYCELQLKINMKQTGNILEIECTKLLEIRDNYSKNLQAERKRVASKEVELEVEVEVEKEEEKEKRLLQDLKPLMLGIDKHFPNFNPYQYQTKKSKEQLRPLECWIDLWTRMLKEKDNIEKPWAWCNQVFAIEAGNVEASIAEEIHEENKKFDLGAMVKPF